MAEKKEQVYIKNADGEFVPAGVRVVEQSKEETELDQAEEYLKQFLGVTGFFKGSIQLDWHVITRYLKVIKDNPDTHELFDSLVDKLIAYYKESFDYHLHVMERAEADYERHMRLGGVPEEPRLTIYWTRSENAVGCLERVFDTPITTSQLEKKSVLKQVDKIINEYKENRGE